MTPLPKWCPIYMAPRHLTRLACLFVFGALGLAGEAFGQSSNSRETVEVNANLRILERVTTTAVQPLRFGKFIRGTPPAIDPVANERNVEGANWSAGVLEITSKSNAYLYTQMPAEVTLQSTDREGEGLLVDLQYSAGEKNDVASHEAVAANERIRASPLGRAFIRVGGSVSPENSFAGRYEGTVRITVSYTSL